MRVAPRPSTAPRSQPADHIDIALLVGQDQVDRRGNV